MRKTLFLLVLLPVLFGCASSYTQQTVDPLSGKVVKTRYSNFFEGEALALDGRIKIIGLAVVKGVEKLGEHREGKLKIPKLTADVKFRVHFYDTRPTVVTFNLHSIFYKDETHSNFLMRSEEQISVVPRSVHLVDTDLYPINGSSKAIKMTVVLSRGGKKDAVNFELKRLTVDEAKAKDKIFFTF